MIGVWRRGEWRAPAAAAAALGVLAACGTRMCGPRADGVDLLRAADRVLEARAAGRDVRSLLGTTVRINDVAYRVLPAGPPSLWRVRLRIPRGGRLSLMAAIPAEHHDRPGVEFVVKIKRGKREHIVASRLLNPLVSPQDRGWVPIEADFASLTGDAELVLETRGFEAASEPTAAVWGAPAVLSSKAEAPVVILYLVDTLRADHTGPYGYGRRTTPMLDAFAQDAVVFDQAIAQASWTKPSVASIFTSMLPGQHRAVQLRDRLDPALVTIAERLSDRGVTTGAAIANSVVYLPEAGFDQGFDHFAGLHGEEGRPSKLVGADVVVDAALRWLDLRRGLPTFLYVHTMDPHVPYAPPPPFDRMFEPHPLPDRPAADPRTDYREGTPGDRERLLAQYDGDIAYGDQEFGRFIRELKGRGLYDRALIIFMADHGEEFQDHGQWLHGRSVFDELIRIPLIVKFPRARHAGRRVAQQVETLDVAPTILQTLGLPAAPPVGGQPLEDVLEGRVPKRPAVSEISHRGIVAHGVRTEVDKYIGRYGPEEDELYFDLTKDPGEKHNAIEVAGERSRVLRGVAETAMAPNPFRFTLRAAGSATYSLALHTSGWMESMTTEGFGPNDRAERTHSGRQLVLQLQPHPDRPREVSFVVRPVGAPVTLDGTRDGARLAPRDLLVGAKGIHPQSVPFTLPEIDSEGAQEGKGPGELFAPPSDAFTGLAVWLVLRPGASLISHDTDACERLRGLGYVGNCTAP